jgi:Family of unknown function (DUF5767)
MSISIADMEAVARNVGPPDFRMDDDIGNIINLGGDDLGLDIISNQSKMGGGDIGISPAVSSGPSVSVPPLQFGGMGDPMMGGSDSLGGIDIAPLESLEPLESIPVQSGGGGLGSEFSIQKEQSPFGNSQSATGPSVQLAAPMRDPEAEKKEKVDLLNKLQRLEQKGFPVSKKFSMDNSLEEIKGEYSRLVDARQLEVSIKFQRQMLMGCITGLEMMNNKFDPFDLKLDGWSESVHENVDDYDEIFEELYDKYKDKAKMSPELRLMMAVVGSGFMCHMTNSFFRKQAPTMDDIFRNNPGLQRQMATAAAQAAGPGFGNFMGMMMGAGGPGQAPAAAMQAQSAANMEPAIPAGPMGGQMPTQQVPPTGAFYSGSAAAMPRGPMQMPMGQQQNAVTARKEMRGPSGVDDILRSFEEARRAEIEEARAAPQMSNPNAQPAVAAAEIASLHSDEFGSQADTVRTGATGGRRRRRAQPPVGNTVAINV